MLKWVKRFFLLLLIIAAVFAGALFTADNDQPVSLLLFGISLPELQLGFWVVIVLLLGAFLGLLLSFLPMLWGRQSMAMKERKIRQLEKELNQLRATSVKG